MNYVVVKHVKRDSGTYTHCITRTESLEEVMEDLIDFRTGELKAERLEITVMK